MNLRELPVMKLLWIWPALCALFIIWKGILPGWQDRIADFHNYYNSAYLVQQGHAISEFYSDDNFHELSAQSGLKVEAKFTPFPPATALVFLPLTVLDELVAKRIWLILNVILIFFMVYLIQQISSWSWVLSVSFVGLFAFPLASNLFLGQLYLLIALTGVLYLRNNGGKFNSLVAGLLGCWAALKYLPVFFLGFGPLRRKPLIIATVSFLVALILPWLIDPNCYSAFLDIGLNHVNGNISGQGQFSFTFQSIDSLLVNLLAVEEESGFVFDAELKLMLKLLIWVVVLGMIFYSWIRYQQKIDKPVLLASSILGISILFPASAAYHLLLLIPSILILSLTVFEKKLRMSWLWVLAVFFAMNLQAHHIPNLSQNQLINSIIHYPRLFGLVFLFILSLVQLPKMNIKHG